jgi:HEAT repeat protein/serine/threonine protein kinase
MADTSPRPAVSDEQRRQLQTWLNGFERTWSEGRLAAYVAQVPAPPSPMRRPVLIALVKIDLERSWQSGRRTSLEDYLRAYPELGTTDTVPFELVRAEHELRRRHEGTEAAGALATRFPRHAAELSRWLTSQKGATALPGPARETVGPRAARETVRGARESASPQHPSTLPGEGTASGQRSLPEQFGRYRILKKLGQGGMGTVYLAQDGELQRSVALKVPLFSEEDQQARARFRREAQAAATLRHPNLCPVYDVGEIDGIHYLTMAYIEGRPLSAVLRGSRPLSQRQAALLLRKLAAALREAHSHGIIHRDLKPANVLLDRSGEPVITDFGLARRAVPGDVRLTKSGAILGTPAYMAPEQVSGTSEVGAVSDLYALGVILYELLTGRLPFDGPVAAVLGQIMVTEPDPPRLHRPDLDPGLEAICLKAMAKKVPDRYASMGELHDALTAWLRTSGAAPSVEPPRQAPHGIRTEPADPEPFDPPLLPPPSVGPVPTQRPGAPASWKPWSIATGLVALVGVAVLGVVFFIRAGNKGTIRIDVDDRNAVVQVDGRQITIENLGEPITLTPGEHDLVVKRGDVEVETRKFTLQRGEKQVLIIRLLDRTASLPPNRNEPGPVPVTPEPPKGPVEPVPPPEKAPPKEPVRAPDKAPALPPSIEALAQKLADGDGWARYQAAEGLRRLGKREAGVPLAARVADDLYDPYPAKQAALEALREVEPGKAGEALARALQSKVEAVRIWACQELGSERGAECVTALVAAAKNGSTGVRAAAARALAKHGEGTARESLRNLLKDREVSVRLAAVEALAGIGGLYPVEALAGALTDEDGSVRGAAARALHTLGERSAVEALHKRVADASWLTGDPRAGKDQALAALRQLDPEKVVPALRGALQTKNESVQVWACRALAWESDREGGTALKEGLGSSSARVRAAAAIALGLRGDGEARAELVKLAEDKDYESRQSVKLGLQYLSQSAEVKAEVEKLHATSDQTRRQAADALKKLGDRSAVPDLMRRVADDAFEGTYSYGGKYTALEALKKLAPEKVSEALSLALRSKNEGVRAWAIGQFPAGDRQALAALHDALQDPASTVRSAAITALSRHSDPSARRFLIALTADRDRSVRLAAFGGLAGQKGSEVLDICCRGLADPDGSIRQQAAYQLGQLGLMAAVPALMKCVADDRGAVPDSDSSRYAALASLKTLAPERAREALQAALESRNELLQVWACSQFPPRDRKAGALLGTTLSDGPASVRKAAAMALGQQDDRVSATALVRALEDRDAEVRAAAASSLGTRREETARAALCTLVKDRVYTVRQAALNALTALGGAEVVNLWIQALNDPQDMIRQTAAYQLKQLGDKSAVDALVKRVADDVADSYGGGKSAALDALRQFAPERATGAILQALKSRNETIRAWACNNLPEKDRESATALTAALKDDRSPQVRRAAASALYRQEGPESATALVAALRDPDSEVRRSAVFSLGHRREKSALTELEQLAQNSKDSLLQSAARSAIQRINGTSP